MVNKLPALAVLVASLAPFSAHDANAFPRQQEVSRIYSLSDVISLMEPRSGQPLYFAAQGEIVKVSYVPISKSIDISTLNVSTAGDELRELSTEDPLTARLRGDFTPNLYIKSTGIKFGDFVPEERTQEVFSRLGESIILGWKNGPEQEIILNSYLQQIGYLLNR